MSLLLICSKINWSLTPIAPNSSAPVFIAVCARIHWLRGLKDKWKQAKNGISGLFSRLNLPQVPVLTLKPAIYTIKSSYKPIKWTQAAIVSIASGN
jgi:hypothetical protein